MKVKVSSYVKTDGRLGKCAKNKTTEAQTDHVKNHIGSFPKMESHYCRKNFKKLYLAPDLNVTTMYRLYRDIYCSNTKIKPASHFVF